MVKKFSQFRKILSWVFPQEITHFPTDLSQEAYIYLYKGELMLCTQTATYSHGLQYTPFSIAFKQLRKNGALTAQLNNGKFLLLGGGLASAAYLLYKKYGLLPTTTVIEIESSYKKASAGFLPNTLWKNLDWQTADAFEFVNNCTSSYDMIGIDLYIHLTMLDQSLTQPFLQKCKKILEPNGIVIMNTFFEEKLKALEFQKIFDEVFGESELLVNDRNYVLINKTTKNNKTV